MKSTKAWEKGNILPTHITLSSFEGVLTSALEPQSLMKFGNSSRIYKLFTRNALDHTKLAVNTAFRKHVIRVNFEHYLSLELQNQEK